MTLTSVGVGVIGNVSPKKTNVGLTVGGSVFGLFS